MEYVMAAAYLQKLRLFNRDVRLYLLSGALASFAYRGIYGVLFNLYLLRLGHGPEFIGLVNAALWLPMIVLSLPAGEFGRRWGVRRTMIVGMILSMAGSGLPPIVEFIPASLRAGWLLTTQSLHGIGGAMFSVSSYPFLMSATHPDERNHAFSMQAALFPLAGFTGSLIGGLLPGVFAPALGVSSGHPAPYRLSLFMAGALFIPSILALVAMREVRGNHAEDTRVQMGPVPWALILPIALFVLLRGAGEGAVRTFSNVYLDDHLGAPTSLIGALTAVSQLLAVPAALAAPLLAGRWGRFRTVVFGSLGVALSMLPLALVPHWSAAGIGLAGIAIMASLGYPAFSVYHQEIVPVGQRATMSGAILTAEALSVSAIAAAGGYIIITLGYSTVFAIAVGLTGVSTFLLWVCFRVPRGELARASAPMEAV